MTKYSLLTFLLSLLFYAKAQNVMLTPEERAYMYHVVEKSPVLKRNMGDLFHYRGDTVYYKFKLKGGKYDSIIDFDSIEQKIIYEPSLLTINSYEFATIENGILAELSSKLALQSLYRELKRRNEQKIEGMSNRVYTNFLYHLTSNLPAKATRYRNEKEEPIPLVIDLLDPNLSFYERASSLSQVQSFNQAEQQQVMDAIFSATQIYIQDKGEEYFSKIGGRGDFYSFLLAAGDGSSTSGLLNERELARTGKHKIGKPKGIGLFTYETRFITHKGNYQTLSPNQSVQTEFSTIDGSEITNLHLNMWGFNKQLQTTVVIRHKDSVYLLYASKISKELSPDTTFGKGSTIHSIIYKLEHKSIPDLDEEINGKEGLKFKLEEAKKAKQLNLIKIKETEIALKGGTQKNHKLKKKNKVVTRQNGQEHVHKSRGKIKTLQRKYAYLINRQAQIEKIQASADAELREEEERLQRFRSRLLELKGFIDGVQLQYNRFGYVYTFADGCTFNSFTQNFKIPDSLKMKDFSVRLVTIGPDAMSKRVDEIQLLTNVTTGKPEDLQVHNFNLSFNDVFDTDSYRIKKLNTKETDRFELSKLMYEALITDKDLLFDLKGNGVGKKVGDSIVVSTDKELKNYPGETKEEQQTNKQNLEFKELRKTMLSMQETSEAVVLKIESFTDPVQSNFSKKNITVQPLKEKYKLTENQLLSAFRTYAVFEKFYGELLRSVYFHYSGKEREKLLDLLQKKFEKGFILVNNKKIPLKEFDKLLHIEDSYYEIKLNQLKAEEDKIKVLLAF